MDFTHPHFAAPAWLALAALAPLAFALLCVYATRARSKQLTLLAEPVLQARLLRSHSQMRRTLKNILLAMTLAAIGLALARPQWGQRVHAADFEGEDVMIVLDCSKSMLAMDIRPNRLERAKLAILDFVQSRPGGRVGLVAFAGQAFVQCPLTFDYDAFRECLLAVDERTIPVQGTDIARGLDEASKAMERDSRRKLIVLVTDGEDLEHAGIQKASELAETGVVVHTIGVGTGEGGILQFVGERGLPEIVRDAQGQPVTTRLDENTLRAVATATDGEYHLLGSMGQGLKELREAMRSGKARSGQAPSQAAGIDRFYWFVGAALILLMAESLIGTRRRLSENRTG
jgi:Ca-activated chloride channel family protein